MILNRNKIAVFLACIIYATSLFVSPQIENYQKSSTNIQQISKSDSWKLSGFTKNEFKTFSDHLATSSAFVWQTDIFLSKLFFDGSKYDILSKSTAYFSILLIHRSGLKAIIFPYHSYW